MSWTKRQITKKAFLKLGIGSTDHDIEPEQFQDALEELDAMMAEWFDEGLDVSWPFPDPDDERPLEIVTIDVAPPTDTETNPQDADLDTDTGIAWSHARAIIYNLAVSIAPEYGIQPAPMVTSKAMTLKQRLAGLEKTRSRRRSRRNVAGQGHRRFNPYNTYNYLPSNADQESLDFIRSSPFDLLERENADTDN